MNSYGAVLYVIAQTRNLHFVLRSYHQNGAVSYANTCFFLNCERIFVVLFVIIKSYHCLTPALLSGTRAQVSFTSTLQGDFIR